MSLDPAEKANLASDQNASPLFIIPCTSDTSFVWCPQVEAGAIIALRAAGSPVTIVERKRIFRPNMRLEVLLVQGAALRDGARCDLTIASESGEARPVARVVRLARWDDMHTQSVLKLMADRPARAGAGLVLERYLSFISAWQAPGRLIAAFPEGCLLALDAACPEEGAVAYAIAEHGLQGVALQLLQQCDGGSICWLSRAGIKHLYVPLKGGLVRVNLEASAPTQSLPPQRGKVGDDALVEGLHRIVENASPELGAWLAGRCKREVIVPGEDVHVHIHRAARLPSGECVIFLTAAGDARHLESVNLTAFGATDAAPVEIIACESEHGAEPWQQQVIVRARAVPPASVCYRLSWACAGQHHVAWIRETDHSDPKLPMLVRAFMPLAQVETGLFPEVLHPLATAPCDMPPGLVQMSNDGLDENAQADVFVFVGQDLEAAHRTVLGLSLTTREIPINVHLCAFDGGITAAAAPWSRTYGLPLAVTCYSARATEAQVARHLFDGDKPRVFCRAGVLPDRHGWLSALLAQLRQGGDDLLLGVHPSGASSPEASSEALNLETLLAEQNGAQLQERAVVAAVAARQGPAATTLARFHTLEAFLLAQACCKTGDATALPLTDSLSFIHSGTTSTADAFHARLDAHSLQTMTQLATAAGRRWRVIRGRKAL